MTFKVRAICWPFMFCEKPDRFFKNEDCTWSYIYNKICQVFFPLENNDFFQLNSGETSHSWEGTICISGLTKASIL